MASKTTTDFEKIQAQLARLTGGHVQVTSQAERGDIVEIGDGQDCGEYFAAEALGVLVALTSEGDEDRDLLWGALEACAVAESDDDQDEI